MIDWDEVFKMKVWQYFKWITGSLILAFIILGIYYSCFVQIGF